MINKVMLFLVALSGAASLLLYLHSKNTLEETLTSNQWKHNCMIIQQADLNGEANMTGLPVQRLHIRSNFHYLPTGKYVKVSTVDVYLNRDNGKRKPDETFKVSESGTWKLVENYLITNQTDIEEWPSKQESPLSINQIRTIKERFIFEEQQSKRIELIRNNSLLLVTNLNRKSHILVSY